MAFFAIQVAATSSGNFFVWYTTAFLGVSSLATGIGYLSSRTNIKPSSLCLISVFSGVAYFLYRIYTTDVQYEARKDLLLVLIAFSAYLSGIYIFSSKKAIPFYIGIVAIVFWTQVASSAYQLLVDKDFHLIPDYIRTHSFDRAAGFYNVANHFATWIILGILPILPLVFTLKSKFLKIVIILTGIASLGVIVFTKSRAGILSYGLGCTGILGLVIFLKSKFFTPKNTLLLLSTVVAMGAILYSQAPKIEHIVKSRIQGNDSVIQSIKNERYRPVLREVAIDQWRESPVIGMGARTYDNYFRANRPPSFPQSAPHSFFVHSEFYHLLAEYGLIGVVFVSLILLFHLFIPLRYFLFQSNTSKNNAFFPLAIVVAVICCLFHSTFDFQFHIPSIIFMFSFLLGALSVSHKTSLKNNSDKVRPVNLIFFLSAVIPGVILLFLTYQYLPGEIKFKQARNLTTNNDYLKRLGLLHQVIENDPQNYKAQYYAGATWNYLAPQHPYSKEKAKKYALDSYKIDPKNIENLVLLGEIEDALENPIQANEYYTMALQLAPRDAWIHLSLGHHYLRNKNWDDAKLFYWNAHGRLHAWRSDWKISLPYIQRLKNLQKDEAN